MKNPEAIAEIREYPPTQILFRVVCVAWMAFAMYKFSINPVFFGLSILAALTVFLLITRMAITVTENAVRIEHQRILPFLSLVLVYPLDEIEEIQLDMADMSIAPRVPTDISVLFPNARVIRPESLNIKRKDTPWKKFRLVGTNEQYKDLVGIVQSMMASRDSR
ncbi:hypothetical protein O3Q51_08270 [Cryomorphaceae bacterium 1068]|nr:hypothetical protein [Cryomorphaceae bacterium 1068]